LAFDLGIEVPDQTAPPPATLPECSLYMAKDWLKDASSNFHPPASANYLLPSNLVPASSTHSFKCQASSNIPPMPNDDSTYMIRPSPTNHPAVAIASAAPPDWPHRFWILSDIPNSRIRLPSDARLSGVLTREFIWCYTRFEKIEVLLFPQTLAPTSTNIVETRLFSWTFWSPAPAWNWTNLRCRKSPIHQRRGRYWSGFITAG